MEQYTVTGMSCAACSARVEKAVSAVPGVTACSVSLLTNSMGVEGTASSTDIIAAVINAGYGAAPKNPGDSIGQTADDSQLTDHETPLLKKRLILSLVFLAVLMYLSMGHMMWDWPLPPFFDNNHVAMGLAQLCLTVAIMVINQRFFISGFKGFVHRAPNMDTLVALGSTAAFAWSTYVLFAMTRAQTDGDAAAVMSFMHDFYFESAGTILTLITVGKMLEARSKGKTTNALKSLMRLAPKTAVLVRDGAEVTVPIEQVNKGDVFVVRAGDSIPVDGVVLDGECAVNEAALTGESVPVDKGPGSTVSAATINQSGFIRCKATHVGEDTTLAKIIQMVSDAAATKAPIARVADKVSGIFVPVVIALALLTIVIWLAFGAPAGDALARGIAVLVISCPCALGLATPVAIMVGNGVAARNGILFKTSAALEETGKVQIAALDKTGTITAGAPVVTDILPAPGWDQPALLSLAASLEQKSEHPLARAVVAHAAAQNIHPAEVQNFRTLPGNGITATLDGAPAAGGSMAYIAGTVELPDALRDAANILAAQGKTLLFFARGGKPAGCIAVADVIKPDSPAAIADLHAMGIHVVMLTGDNEKTANAIGKQAGVDEVIAGVLPSGKENAIRLLQQKGRVAMVGDGINDAPALTRADVGIAIGAGTDIAIDSADVVLMKSSLADAAAAIRLSRATMRNIKENLFWAFGYNIIGIPLAAGAFIALLGWKMNPMFGAAAMSVSSFLVVTNALRLNLLQLHPKAEQKEQLRVLLTIEGMMCSHCEMRVKKALESIPQVAEAVVSHKEGTARVTLREALPQETLKNAVEAQDYKVLSIR